MPGARTPAGPCEEALGPGPALVLSLLLPGAILVKGRTITALEAQNLMRSFLQSPLVGPVAYIPCLCVWLHRYTLPHYPVH